MIKAPTKGKPRCTVNSLVKRENHNRKRVAPRRDALPAAATRTTVVCRATRRTLHCWRTRRTPAARVGLHQTLANSRETIHTIPRNALARARPAPIEQFQLEPGRARPPRLPKHRATRCRAPRASCCPSTHWRAGGRPRPLWLPAVARASRRARSTDLPRICRRRLPRARALQPWNRPSPRAPKRRRPALRFAMRCCMLGAPRCALRKSFGFLQKVSY